MFPKYFGWSWTRSTSAAIRLDGVLISTLVPGATADAKGNTFALDGSVAGIVFAFALVVRNYPLFALARFGTRLGLEDRPVEFRDRVARPTQGLGQPLAPIQPVAQVPRDRPCGEGLGVPRQQGEDVEGVPRGGRVGGRRGASPVASQHGSDRPRAALAVLRVRHGGSAVRGGRCCRSGG